MNDTDMKTFSEEEKKALAKRLDNSEGKDLLERKTYFYELPEELIAQHPAEKRDMSRLLVCGRDGSLSDRHFRDIEEYLHPGDVLVVNRSKVIPARVLFSPGSSEVTGSYECLLLKDVSRDREPECGAGEAIWECIVRPGRRFKPGRIFFTEKDPSVRAEVVGILPDGNRILKFHFDESESFLSMLDRIGDTPLPPYIKEKAEDPSRYQTVYAKEEGSAAAPTAGLHFTTELLEKLKAKGVIVSEVVLHVGLGTFRPVKEDNILMHHMHTEHYMIPKETAKAINDAKAAGKRVIAVGTTSTRTLEGAYAAHGGIVPCSGDTSIFIYPGYDFKVIDALITNFHLPESTLIMLVSAFLGYDRTMAAYRHAVGERYRFFSFGDACLIL